MAAAAAAGAGSSNGRQLLGQGAEARVERAGFFGRAAIVKVRFAKTYRHPELDAKLNKDRTTHEVRVLLRCRQAGLQVPTVYFVDKANHSIWMQFIDAPSLKQHFYDHGVGLEGQATEAANIGRALARMHAAGVIHGDLTTSNMLRLADKTIALIDFGLSFNSSTDEDRAVDLYVLERALASTHPKSEALFTAVLQSYEGALGDAAGTMRRLEAVRRRGRKREMFG